MSNRAQRRKKPQAVSLPKSQEKLLQRMYKNGITMEDLDKAHREGIDKGIEVGRTSAIKTCYAATCLAARDVLELDKQTIYELLCKKDEHVCETLSSLEAIDKVFDEMGIKINFHEPFDRIEQKE